jgi:phosphoribosyl 1,2-cyclic phosphodiesterase
MKIIVLQSGSNGNAVYVESNGTRLLLDAGISGIRAQERLAAFDRDIHDIDGVIISHDHSDHSRCLGIYQRKFQLPVHVTQSTLRSAEQRCRLGKLHDIRHFAAGETLHFENLAVHTVPTPHDGVDGVAFVVDDGSHRVGVLTDLGHPFDGLDDLVGSLDGLLLESNYDPQMLDEGLYPDFLKHRIRGPGGHLSNVEAAQLIAHAAGEQLRWVCLAHLSEENNRPNLALKTTQKMLGDRIKLRVASRYEPTGIFET